MTRPNNLCKNLAGFKANDNLVKETESIRDQEISYEESFDNGLLQVLINGEYAYVNLKGELIIPPKKFDEIGEFSEGLAAFVDRQGEIAFYLDQDLLSLSQANKECSHYNEDMCQYQIHQYSKFENGLAKVIRIDNREKAAKPYCTADDKPSLNYVYVNRQGKIVKEEPFV